MRLICNKFEFGFIFVKFEVVVEYINRNVYKESKR